MMIFDAVKRDVCVARRRQDDQHAAAGPGALERSRSRWRPRASPGRTGHAGTRCDGERRSRLEHALRTRWRAGRFPIDAGDRSSCASSWRTRGPSTSTGDPKKRPALIAGRRGASPAPADTRRCRARLLHGRRQHPASTFDGTVVLQVNPHQRERSDGSTRRHFLSGAGLGLGAAGHRTRVAPGATAVQDGGVLRATHFPAQARSASSTSSRAALPRSSTCSITSRCSRSGTARSCPTSVRQRPAPDRHVGATRRRCPLAGSRFFVRSATATAARGCPSSCRTPRASSTSSASSGRCTTEAINHDPAITFFMTGSEIAGRPSMGARGSATGSGSMNPQPAGVLRAGEQGQGRPAALRAPLGLGLPAGAPPGRPAARGSRTRCSISREPRRACRRSLRRRTVDALARLERQLQGSSARATAPGRRPHRAGRAGLPDAEPRSPRWSDLSDEPQEVFDLYGEDARDPGTYAANCAARAAAYSSAACASSSSSIRAGTSTATCRPASAMQCKPRPTRPRPRSSSTWSAAACSKTPWSSGAASSAAPTTPRAS